MENKRPKILISILILLVAGSFFVYKYIKLRSDNKKQLESIAKLEERIKQYEETLTQKENENVELANALFAEQEKVGTISEQFDEVSDTVNRLEKLSKTDKELLHKYSNVYFLNEHYKPEDLSKIDEKYLFDKKKVSEIHSKVEPFLEDMLEDAKDDGFNILVISGFRSFGEQTILKSKYSVRYGNGANTFSADQGFSEHQLGTTLDFTNDKIGANFESFGQTESFKWLQENAHKYGFILSYPEGNKYYTFEPWHWRFVGVALAKRLYREKKNFYDYDQRKIDGYLIRIFD